ncbi:MAG: hypothetical protein COA79_20260 [Planctomycetota bacterium]|nr:MAG: hypothetical protein COA79_20260 [Planctomycetota bacterium]
MPKSKTHTKKKSTPVKTAKPHSKSKQVKPVKTAKPVAKTPVKPAKPVKAAKPVTKAPVKQVKPATKTPVKPAASQDAQGGASWGGDSGVKQPPAAPVLAPAEEAPALDPALLAICTKLNIPTEGIVDAADLKARIAEKVGSKEYAADEAAPVAQSQVAPPPPKQSSPQDQDGGAKWGGDKPPAQITSLLELENAMDDEDRVVYEDIKSFCDTGMHKLQDIEARLDTHGLEYETQSISHKQVVFLVEGNKRFRIPAVRSLIHES